MIAPVKIVVLVPTFRRPELLTLTLDSLREQDIAEAFAIVVSDNDQPAGSARSLVADWAAAHGFASRLLYVEAADPGIAASREAGVAAALASFPEFDMIAMLDDDAVAERGWLRALAGSLRELDADVVSGPVIFEFEPSAPAWFTDMSPFRVPIGRTGLNDRLRGACNTAIGARLLKSLPRPYYDRAFAAGGEDVDFFARARQSGARIGWCAEAVVREPVPLERCTLDWLKGRMHRAGRTMVAVDRKRRSASAVWIGQGVTIARSLVGSWFRLLRARSDGERIDASMRRELALGRLAGLLDCRMA